MWCEIVKWIINTYACPNVHIIKDDRGSCAAGRTLNCSIEYCTYDTTRWKEATQRTTNWSMELVY
jgi:hypothetical protein